MSDAERRLREDGATRRAARSVFDARLGAMRADLAERGIGGRIKDEALGQTRDTAHEALAVARESKGIIAGTLAALGLWFARKPLLDWFRCRQAEVQADELDSGEQTGELHCD